MHKPEVLASISNVLKRLSILALLLLSIVSFGQTPQLIPYQAIARDATGNAVLNQNIGLRFSIHDQTISGTIVWQEAQIVLSGPLGVIVTSLGSVSDLSSVNWANGYKFLQVEMDVTGGTNYMEIGTQQMMSVPYALYAGEASNGFSSVSESGDTLFFSDGSFILIPGVSDANNTTGGLIQPDQHTCGARYVHNPFLTYGTLIDQEGNSYKTIVTGSPVFTQEWMAENLKTSIYRNGDPIQSSLSNTELANTTNGAWTYYNNDSTYACPYGKLYNWYACSDSRQLCPTGWRIPTTSDFTTLINAFGSELVAGGKIKSQGTSESIFGYWLPPNGEATNTSGFSALPGGGLQIDQSVFIGYWGLGMGASFWSANQWNVATAIAFGVSYQGDDFGQQGFQSEKKFGYSVRCIREN
jgi:uncharacterized protein (TIGR02145 family)